MDWASFLFVCACFFHLLFVFVSLGMALANNFKQETKYFGVNPVHFTEEFIDQSLDTSCDLVDALQQHLVERLDESGDEEQIVQCANRVMEVMESGLKKNLDKWELYVLRNILNVPDNIDKLVKEDEERKQSPELLSSLDADEMYALDNEIEELRKKVAAARYVNSLLASQSKKGKELKTEQQKLTQCADNMKFDLEFNNNELTPMMNDLMEKATVIHQVLSYRDEREKDGMEGDSQGPNKTTMTNLSSDSLKGLGGTF
uniref:Protein MIS12 homolog n=1 Tax=Paramoeba aestuarina TaxID=180227 RepID=A0A7S4UHQ4_9EUKA